VSAKKELIMSGEQSTINVVPVFEHVAASGYIRWERENDFVIDGIAALCVVTIEVEEGEDPFLKSVARVGMLVRDDCQKVRGLLRDTGFAIPLQPSLGLRRGMIERPVVACSAIIQEPNDEHGACGLDGPCVLLDPDRKPDSVLVVVTLVNTKLLGARHGIREDRPLTWSPAISMGGPLVENGYGLDEPVITADGSVHQIPAFIPVGTALPFGWGDIDRHDCPEPRLWNLHFRKFDLDGTPKFEITRHSSWK